MEAHIQVGRRKNNEVDISGVSLSSIILIICSWAAIGLLFFKVYKKGEQLQIWKALVFLFIGMFTFNISLEWWDLPFRIPVIPLGLGILYAFFGREGRRESWQRYRRFAWIGFYSTFFFLAAALLQKPLDGWLYPKDTMSTYISDVNQMEVIGIHPDAKRVSLNKGSLQQALQKADPRPFDVEAVYNEVFDGNGKHERFPYLISGAIPKRGSGMEAIIYIEEDGRGFLISPSDGRQLYFRTEETVLMEGGQTGE